MDYTRHAQTRCAKFCTLGYRGLRTIREYKENDQDDDDGEDTESASERMDNVAPTSQVNQSSQQSEDKSQTTKATTPGEFSGAGAGDDSISGAGAGSASTSGAGVDHDASTSSTAISGAGTCDAEAEAAAALLSSIGENQLSKLESTTTSGTNETSSIQTGLNNVSINNSGTTGEARVLRSGRSRLNTESKARSNSVTNQGNKQKERKPAHTVQTPLVGEAEQEKQKNEICDIKADWFVSNGICVDEH